MFKTFLDCCIMLLHACRSYSHGACNLSAYAILLRLRLETISGVLMIKYEERDVCYNKNCLNSNSKKENRFQRYHLFSIIEKYFICSKKKNYKSKVIVSVSYISYNLQQFLITQSFYQRYESLKKKKMDLDPIS